MEKNELVSQFVEIGVEVVMATVGVEFQFVSLFVEAFLEFFEEVEMG